MRILLLVTLFSLATPLAFADDLRSFNEKDMADLSGRMGKALRKCPQLRKGAEAEISFRNETSEFIDKDAFTKAIQAQLPSSASGPGKKYDLAVKLASRAMQKDGQYEGTYRL